MGSGRPSGNRIRIQNGIPTLQPVYSGPSKHFCTSPGESHRDRFCAEDRPTSERIPACRLPGQRLSGQTVSPGRGQLLIRARNQGQDLV